MLFPYSTDAPIYHWPYATVGLIVVNTLVFLGMATGNIANPETWILTYGSTLTPLQWLTSMFAHLDMMHLLGNMIFLWVFGLIVEGKLGWWKFLLCYLFIGVVQSAGEQSLMLMLGDEGGSLGASSAIYGILAIAAIWAPKNEVVVFYWFFFVIMGTGEIPVLALVAFYIGWDVLLWLLLGFHSSSWLHVGGVMVGIPLGIALLKLNLVDCEGWDLFHVFHGETGKSPSEREQPAINQEQLRDQQQKRDQRLLEGADQQILLFLRNKNPEAAYRLLQKFRGRGDGVKLPREALLMLVSWLHQQRRWQDSCPLLAEIVERFPQQSDPARLKLAHICLVESERPGRALELLEEINLRQLSEPELKLARKLAHRAKQMQQEGVVELDSDGW